MVVQRTNNIVESQIHPQSVQLHYTEPMNRVFHTVPIPMAHFFLIGAVASLVLWVEEIRKVFARRGDSRQAND